MTPIDKLIEWMEETDGIEPNSHADLLWRSVQAKAKQLSKEEPISSVEKGLENALDKFIREKHTQEECIGFIEGYKAAPNHLDEIEKWVKDNQRKYDISYVNGTHDSCVHTPQLINFLNNLK